MAKKKRVKNIACKGAGKTLATKGSKWAAAMLAGKTCKSKAVKSSTKKKLKAIAALAKKLQAKNPRLTFQKAQRAAAKQLK